MRIYNFPTLFLIFFIIKNCVNSSKLEKIKLQQQLMLDNEKTHPCLRDCVTGETKICNYTFQVDTYTTMSVLCGACPLNITACSNPGCITGGGISRPVVNVNRRVPGPPIHVCENDTVIVDVINDLSTQILTIHWHGIHQINSSFMDGAPYITQCPILPFNSFRYKFLAYPHGTHMWHGHVGFQESDGLFGAFVVRRNEPAKIKSLYDFDLPEHTMTVWHWYNETNNDILPPILHRNGSVFGFGLLINDKAAFKKFNNNGTEVTTPREKFIVNKGKRYRFRIISNSAIYCPVQISIDDHILTIISSDTTAFEPVEAESLILSAGERFSFVVEANQKEGCYWVRFRGMGDCGPKKSSVHEEAYLCYEGYDERPNGTITYDDGRRSGVLVNPVEVYSADYSKNTLVFLNNLTSVEPELHNYSGTPDVIIYLQLHTRVYDVLESPGPWPQFNNISFDFPNQCLLSQRYELQESGFCGAIPDANHCLDDFCSCMYMQKVPLNALVEIVMVDISITREQDHPIHIHGYKFHVVAMDIVGEGVTLSGVREMNEQGKIPKKLENATAKDTISVPNAGYAVVRFVTDNPGFWLFHCHVSNHMELGMSMVLQVGSYSDMANTPPNFPTCGSSFYNIDEELSQPSSGENLKISCICFMIIFFCIFKLA